MGIYHLFNHFIAKSIHNAVANIMGIDEPYDLTQDELDKIQSFIHEIEKGTKAKELEALYHGSTDYTAKLMGIQSVSVTEEEQKILDKLLTTENGIRLLENIINTAEPYIWKFIIVAALQHFQLGPEKINLISQAIDAKGYAESAEKILEPTFEIINRTDLSQYLRKPYKLR